MSLCRNPPSCQFCFGWASWQDLSVIFIMIDLLEHELSSFDSILHLTDQSEVFRVYNCVSVNCWLIWLWVLGFIVTSVEKTIDFTWHCWSIVVLLISQVMRYPTSINQKATFFSFLVQVCEEWSNDFDTFFTLILLFNMIFFGVIKDTSNLHWSHWPFLLKSIEIICLGPDELPISKWWSDIHWSLTQELLSTTSMN